MPLSEAGLVRKTRKQVEAGIEKLISRRNRERASIRQVICMILFGHYFSGQKVCGIRAKPHLTKIRENTPKNHFSSFMLHNIKVKRLSSKIYSYFCSTDQHRWNNGLWFGFLFYNAFDTPSSGWMGRICGKVSTYQVRSYLFRKMDFRGTTIIFKY